MENTARIHIMGAAAVLVSTVSLEDWKLVEKYAPEMLVVVDEQGEPAFKVATVSGSGSVNKYGVCWGAYVSDEGMASVTVLLDDEIEDKREAVSDIMGSALLELIDIEKEIPGVIEGIREKQERINALIDSI